MMRAMKPYLDLLRHVLDHGERRGDRTGTGTISVFGTQSRYDLRDGFPAVTVKKLQWRSVVLETLWFLSGSTRVADLGCGIWDAWTRPDGTIGSGYGHQWRHWGAPHAADGRPQGGVDQVAELLETLRRDPTSRRMVVSAWNVADVPEMALPPCHTFWQVYASFECQECRGRAACATCGGTGTQDTPQALDLHLYCRSQDLAVGTPFNLASYALVLTLLAREMGLVPRYLVHSVGDAHVYANHEAGVREMLGREPLDPPRLVLPDAGMWEVVERRLVDEVRLEGYQHHPAIRFDVAV